MVETIEKTNQIPPEVQRQFFRRTPIKLKQFSRLLNDMIDQQIDSLRIKALLSQVTKTREACVKQDFESTGRLLHQLMKLLSMSQEAIESQKPLLKRLSRKLMEHAEKLELGVKPQKEQAPPTPEPTAPTKETAKTPTSQDESPTSQQQKPSETSDADSTDVKEDTDEAPFGMYLDRGQLIFVSDNKQTVGLNSNELCEQFDSMGIESSLADNLPSAFALAEKQPNSIIIAPLSCVEPLDVRADEEIETARAPLIFIADEDNQENRAKGIRNGGTGFAVEPVSLSMVYDQIERVHDVQAEAPKRVLVMEDSKAQARYYQKVLSKGPFEIRVVNNPSVFLEALRGFDPETVLMDMQMPDSSGIELTQMIRQMHRYAHLPVIFLSAEENLRKQNQALMSGGTAFIVKPVQKEQLMFMANLFTQRYRDLNPQIEINPDTGLHYAPQFKQVISLESARMSRNPGSIALALICLDDAEELANSAHFSFINSAIQQLATLLKKRLRKTDVVGHVDSNKLGVILTSGKHPDWVNIMRAVQQQFAEILFHLQNEDRNLTVSIGISTLRSNFNAHQWLERSHRALNEAMESGASGLECYDSEDS
ncbi:MAG: response regulator [Kangiellaceae bacterium]|jgi:diguanylate cyclase (GGDEF)-like protein